MPCRPPCRSPSRTPCTTSAAKRAPPATPAGRRGTRGALRQPAFLAVALVLAGAIAMPGRAAPVTDVPAPATRESAAAAGGAAHPRAKNRALADTRHDRGAAGARQDRGVARTRPAAGTPFPRSHRAEFGRFAAALAERESVPAAWVLSQLGKARHVGAVRRLIMPPPPGQPKNWQAYHDRFVEPQRIAAGLSFWREHEASLQRAEADYGVPPEIVVAIVGVETFYGRITGNFRVLDALATLAFDFPTGRKDRSGFFRAELETFLLWCRREGIDTTEPRGSYAGAMGLPQFMPSSLARLGTDYDGDARVDLLRSGADVVGSVARYLADAGWQRGLATHYAVQPPAAEDARGALMAPDILPRFSAAEFAAHGAELEPAGRQHVGPLALVALENGGREWSWFAGSTNFYAITRYNWSSYYAMAVIHLAQALKAAR